jgi:hypothetical protein
LDGNEELVKGMDLPAGDFPIPIVIVIADRHGPRSYDKDGVVHRLPVEQLRHWWQSVTVAIAPGNAR